MAPVRAGAKARAELVGNPNDPSVERQLANIGKVAHVTIREADDGPSCHCFIKPDMLGVGIMIEYASIKDQLACRPILEALVTALGDYHCFMEDIESDALE